MSNYVWNRVICREETAEGYAGDLFAGLAAPERPAVTREKREDGLCEIRFCTRWEYPIRAIRELLGSARDAEWYAVEENRIYVSRFTWRDGLKEDILYIEEEFLRWEEENRERAASLEDPDDAVWHFLPGAKGTWQNWESTDDFARYLDVAAVYAPHPFQ